MNISAKPCFGKDKGVVHSLSQSVAHIGKIKSNAILFVCFLFPSSSFQIYGCLYLINKTFFFNRFSNNIAFIYVGHRVKQITWHFECSHK